MNGFNIGETYSRVDICKRLGGDTRSYMPICKDAVVCVCLKTELNPDAPEIVLVGKGKQIESAAQIFLKQNWMVPLFIKKGENEWEYKGNYRAVSAETDPNKVAMLGARAGRFDVVFALKLEK
jgi:hypothetical protein